MYEATIEVVIVDDDFDVRHSTELMARSAGYDVVASCDDAGSALQAIEALRPDAVITDLQMLGPGGLELIRAMRQSPSLCLTPAVLYTGSPELIPPLDVPARTVVVSKPASVCALAAAISSVTEEGFAPRELVGRFCATAQAPLGFPSGMAAIIHGFTGGSK